MTTPTCPRIWMAEAVEDGHLGENERASFQRHAADCADCNRATSELAHLREVMSSLPAPAMSDIERHQQRVLLIERAYRQIVRSGSRTRHLSLVAAGTLALTLVGVAWLRWPATTTSQPGLAETTNILVPPVYEITPLQKATWAREEVGSVARISLTSGSAEFHVHPLKTGQRFLVVLPDGEIEVRGTRFVVAVRGSETRYVVVTEGKVVWRRSGDAERLLLAGERWDHARKPEAQETVRAVGHTTTTDGLAPRPAIRAKAVAFVSPGRAKALSASRASVAPPPGANAPRESPPDMKNGPGATSVTAGRLPASTDVFAEGIVAFHGGRYEDADKLLQTFSTKNPSDPRTEDAAFLRAVSRSRMGDGHGAAILAREYLRRFPKGLRRPEAEALSTRAP